jgi:hypothetical protein
MKLSLSGLDLQIQNLYSSLFSEKPESLRQFLLDSPKQELSFFERFDVTKFVIKDKSKRQLVRLAILSWYFPEEIRVLFQMNLKEIWTKQDRFCVEKEILLSSKTLCLAWILHESGWKERDFFGNILNVRECTMLLQSLSFWRLSQRKVKKYTGYCRGYQESNRGAPRSFSPEMELWVLDEKVWTQKELQFHTEVAICLMRLRRFLAG